MNTQSTLHRDLEKFLEGAIATLILSTQGAVLLGVIHSVIG